MLRTMGDSAGGNGEFAGSCVAAHNTTSKSFVECNPLPYPKGKLKVKEL